MTDVRQVGVSRDDVLGCFGAFCAMFMDEGFFDPAIHIDVCNHLQNSSRIELIILPRGYLKSTIAAQMYPLWRATKDPTRRFLLCSKTAGNAHRHNEKIMGIITGNPLYRAWFPERIPNTNRGRWSVEAATIGGRVGAYDAATFETGGMETRYTGRHFTDIVLDDPISPDLDEMTKEMAMPSPKDIENAIGFWKLTNSLLVDKATGKRVLPNTRWMYHDLTAYVLDHHPEVVPFDVPCVKVDEKWEPVLDGNGKRIPTHPRRFPLEILEELERDYGPYYFSTLYMNRPRDQASMVFRVQDWLEYYEVPPGTGHLVLTVDPGGLRESDKGAFDAYTLCEHNPGSMHVLDYRLGLYSPSELLEGVLDMADRWSDGVFAKPDILIEDYVYQKSLKPGIEEAMRRRGVRYNVGTVGRGNLRSKPDRIRALQPPMASHQIFVKAGMRELIQHLTEFPFGNVLDLLDALAWQMTQFRHGNYPRKAAQSTAPWLTMGQYMQEMVAGTNRCYGMNTGLLPRVDRVLERIGEPM